MVTNSTVHAQPTQRSYLQKGITMTVIEQILFDLYIYTYGYDHVVKHYKYFSKCIQRNLNYFLGKEFRDYRKAIDK